MSDRGPSIYLTATTNKPNLPTTIFVATCLAMVTFTLFRRRNILVQTRKSNSVGDNSAETTKPSLELATTTNSAPSAQTSTKSAIHGKSNCNNSSLQHQEEEPPSPPIVVTVKSRDSLEFTKEHFNSSSGSSEIPKPNFIQLNRLSLRANDSMDQLNSKEQQSIQANQAKSRSKPRTLPPPLPPSSLLSQNSSNRKNVFSSQAATSPSSFPSPTPTGKKRLASTTDNSNVKKGNLDSTSAGKAASSAAKGNLSSPLPPVANLNGGNRPISSRSTSPTPSTLTSSSTSIFGLNSGLDRKKISHALKLVSKLFSQNKISSSLRSYLKSLVLDGNEEVLNVLSYEDVHQPYEEDFVYESIANELELMVRSGKI